MATRQHTSRSKPDFDIVPVANRPEILTELGDAAQNWFCLFSSGKLQRTPSGIPFAHPSMRLLKAIGAEVSKSPDVINMEQLSLYAMFCTLKDFVEPEGKEPGTCQYLILTDPTLHLCAGPEAMDQVALLEPVHEDFRKRGLATISFPQGIPPDAQIACLNDRNKQDLEQVVTAFDARLAALSSAQRCVVKYGGHAHHVFVPAVLLAESACSVEEYVGMLIAAHCLIAGVFGGTQSAENKVRSRINKDATLMLRFRDLADVSLAVSSCPAKANGTMLRRP